MGKYGHLSSGSLDSSYFQFANWNGQSTCGLVGPLDFYQQSDGTYKFFINQGDGTVQGTCFSNKGSHIVCNGDTSDKFYEQYLCYTQACK